MNQPAYIEAEVTFLSEAEGGRAQPPASLSGGGYRPHLVVGDPNQRQAVIVGNEVREPYLGVAFMSCSAEVRVGVPLAVELALLYHPHPAYSSLVPGATFTVREGAKVVGFGRVKTAPSG